MVSFAVGAWQRLTEWLVRGQRVAPPARGFARDGADDVLEHSQGRRVFGRTACEEPVPVAAAA